MISKEVITKLIMSPIWDDRVLAVHLMLENCTGQEIDALAMEIDNDYRWAYYAQSRNNTPTYYRKGQKAIFLGNYTLATSKDALITHNTVYPIIYL